MAFNLVAQLQIQTPSNLGKLASDIQAKLKNISATVNLQINPASVSGLNTLNQQIVALNANLRSLVANSTAASSSLSRLGSSFSSSNAAVSSSSKSVSSASTSMFNYNKVAGEATNATEEFGRAAGLAGRRFLGFSLVAGTVVGSIAAIKSGFIEALKFEREFIKLTQVGTSTRAELAELNSEITKLSTTLGVSSKDLVTTAVTLRQAGLTVREVTAAMEVLAKTTLAPTFDNIKNTTEGAIAVMAQFRLETKELEQALGSANAVAAAFAVESKDIITAIQKSGGAFKSVGGDLNEFIALFTSVRATTRESAESIATGLRTVFTRLQRKDTVEALRELGVNLRYTREEASLLGNTNLESQFVGAYEAVRRLSVGLKDIRSTDSRYSAVVEQLGGYRQISKVLPLLQQFETSQKALNIAQSGFASITTSAEEAQNTFLVKLTKVKEEFLALARTIASSNAFQGFLDTSLRLAKAFLSITDALSPLIPLLTTLATIKLASNLTSFFSGVTQGFSGVGPKKLASGGVVPGSGSGDIVPAMLTPGEFVVRKSSARAIGYNNLSKMNKGGRVQYLAPGGEVFKVGNYDLSSNNVKWMNALANAKDKGASLLRNPSNQRALIGILGKPSTGDTYDSVPEIFKKLGLKSQNLTELNKDFKKANEFRTERQELSKSGIYKKDSNLIVPFKGETMGYIASGLPGGEKGKEGRDALNAGLRIHNLKTTNVGEKTNQAAKASLQSAGIKNVRGGINVHILGSKPTKDFQTDIIGNLKTSIQGIFSNKFGGSAGSKPLSDSQLNTISGYMFEKYIEGVSGKETAGGGAAFEYTKGAKSPSSTLGKAFDKFVFPGPIDEKYIDLKHRYSRDNNADIIKKYLNVKSGDGSLNAALGITGLGVPAAPKKGSSPAKSSDSSSELKLATGGVVPGQGNGDTVPAKLTPGEFVIRKSSAKAIGYDNLSKMNKGGSVQHFAAGGKVLELNPPKGFLGLLSLDGGESTGNTKAVVDAKYIEDKKPKSGGGAFATIKGKESNSQKSAEALEILRPGLPVKNKANKTGAGVKLTDVQRASYLKNFPNIKGPLLKSLDNTLKNGRGGSTFVADYINDRPNNPLSFGVNVKTGAKGTNYASGARTTVAPNDNIAVNIANRVIDTKSLNNADAIKQVDAAIKQGIAGVANVFTGALKVPPVDASDVTKNVLDNSLTTQGRGRIFEAGIKTLSKRKTQTSSDNFDFAPINKTVSKLFGGDNSLEGAYGDAKIANNKDATISLVRKGIRQFANTTSSLEEEKNSSIAGVAGTKKTAGVFTGATGPVTGSGSSFSRVNYGRFAKGGQVRGYAEGGFVLNNSQVDTAFKELEAEHGVDFRRASKKVVIGDFAKNKSVSDADGFFNPNNKVLALNKSTITTAAQLKDLIVHESLHGFDNLVGEKKTGVKGSFASDLSKGAFSKAADSSVEISKDRLEQAGVSKFSSTGRYLTNPKEAYATNAGLYLSGGKDSSYLTTNDEYLGGKSSDVGTKTAAQSAVNVRTKNVEKTLNLIKRTNLKFAGGGKIKGVKDYLKNLFKRENLTEIVASLGLAINGPDAGDFLEKQYKEDVSKGQEVAKFSSKRPGIRPRPYAMGGASSDTVPAMLTPGEFVINKSSASRIGLGNLNQMNQTGKVKGYAKGGYVQHFATGKNVEAPPIVTENLATVYNKTSASVKILAKTFEDLSKVLEKTNVKATTAEKAAARVEKAAVGRELAKEQAFKAQLEGLAGGTLLAGGTASKAAGSYNVGFTQDKTGAKNLAEVTSPVVGPPGVPKSALVTPPPLYANSENPAIKARNQKAAEDAVIAAEKAKAQAALENRRLGGSAGLKGVSAQEIDRRVENKRITDGSKSGLSIRNAAELTVDAKSRDKFKDSKSDIRDTRQNFNSGKISKETLDAAEKEFNKTKDVYLSKVSSEEAKIRTRLEKSELDRIQTLDKSIPKREAQKIAKENVDKSLTLGGKITGSGLLDTAGSSQTRLALAKEEETKYNKIKSGELATSAAASAAKPTKEPGFFKRQFSGYTGTPEEVQQKKAAFSQRVSTGALFGGSILASYGGQQFENKQEAIDLAAKTGDIGDTSKVENNATAGGALTGAATGAALGSIGGPIGIAAGALAGGLYGALDGMKEAEKQIREAKIGQALTELATTIENVNRSGSFSDADREKVVGNIDSIKSKNVEKANEESSTRIGRALGLQAGSISGDVFGAKYDAKKFSAVTESQNRQTIGKELPGIYQILGKESQKLGANLAIASGTVNLSSDAIDKSLTKLDGEFIEANRELLQVIAEFKKTSVSAVAKDFTRQRLEGFTTQRRQESGVKAGIDIGQQLGSFSRLSVLIEQTVNSMKKLEAASLNLNDAFEGTITNVLNTDSNFALSNKDFTTSSRGLSGALGGEGGELAGFANDFALIKDKLTSVLPSVLSQEGLKGDTIELKIREAIERSLGGKNKVSERQSSILGTVTRAAAGEQLEGLRNSAKTNIGSTVEKLTAEANPINDFSKISGILSDNANKFVGELIKYQGRIQRVGEQEDKLRQIQLAKLRNNIERTAEANGARSGALDKVSVDTLNAPIRQRAERLSGLGGNAEDVESIRTKLSGLSIAIDIATLAQQNAFETNKFASEASRQSAEKLTELKRQSSDLQTALKDLTDVATRNAAAQEKLSKIQEDRSSRLSFGEKFLRAGNAERNDINRGIRLTNQAATTGNIETFNQKDINAILDTLSSLGNSKVNFGGKEQRAGDVKENLIRDAFKNNGGGGQQGLFDVSQDSKNEEKTLIDGIRENFERGEAAQKAIQSEQKNINEALVNDLRGLQAKFFADLSTNLTKEAISKETQNLDKLKISNTESSDKIKSITDIIGPVTGDTIKKFKGSSKEISRLQDIKTQDKTLDEGFFRQRKNAENNTLKLDSTNRNDIRTSIFAFVKSELAASGITDESVVARGSVQAYENSLRNSGGFKDTDKSRQATRGTTGLAIQNEIETQKIKNKSEESSIRANLSNRGFSPEMIGNIDKAIAGDKLDALNKALSSFNDEKSLEALNDSIKSTAIAIAESEKRISELKGALPGDKAKEIFSIIPELKASGGAITGFKSVGTDTVPAMLTPGEFVVNAKSSRENRGLLEKINSGTQYLQEGGNVEGKGFFGRLVNKVKDKDSFSNTLENLSSEDLTIFYQQARTEAANALVNQKRNIGGNANAINNNRRLTPEQKLKGIQELKGNLAHNSNSILGKELGGKKERIDFILALPPQIRENLTKKLQDRNRLNLESLKPDALKQKYLSEYVGEAGIILKQRKAVANELKILENQANKNPKLLDDTAFSIRQNALLTYASEISEDNITSNKAVAQGFDYANDPDRSFIISSIKKLSKGPTIAGVIGQEKGQLKGANVPGQVNKNIGKIEDRNIALQQNKINVEQNKLINLAEQKNVAQLELERAEQLQLQQDGEGVGNNNAKLNAARAKVSALNDKIDKKSSEVAALTNPEDANRLKSIEPEIKAQEAILKNLAIKYKETDDIYELAKNDPGYVKVESEIKALRDNNTFEAGRIAMVQQNQKDDDERDPKDPVFSLISKEEYKVERQAELAKRLGIIKQNNDKIAPALKIEEAFENKMNAAKKDYLDVDTQQANVREKIEKLKDEREEIKKKLGEKSEQAKLGAEIGAAQNAAGKGKAKVVDVAANPVPKIVNPEVLGGPGGGILIAPPKPLNDLEQARLDINARNAARNAGKNADDPREETKRIDALREAELKQREENKALEAKYGERVFGDNVRDPNINDLDPLRDEARARLTEQNRDIGFTPQLQGEEKGLNGGVNTGESKGFGGGLLDGNKLNEEELLQLRRLPLASGGAVPGSGHGDTVPAMLTPGEFVLNKTASEAIGLSTLYRMNNVGKTQNFASGGPVRSNGSANRSGGGISQMLDSTDFSQAVSRFENSLTILKTAFAAFDNSANALAQAMQKFPSTITGSFSHAVTVNITGAEALAALSPALGELAIKKAEQVLSRYIAANDGLPTLNSASGDTGTPNT